MSGINVDITERKLAEIAWKQSEAFGWAVFEASPDCVKIIDAAGNLERMNVNGQTCMEIDEFDTVCGLGWSKLWPKEARHLVDAACVEALEGRVGRFSHFCPTAKGTPKYWDVMVTAIPGGTGARTRLLASSRDVTERRRAEEHARLMVTEVNHRAKNMLSLVQAIAKQTVATRPEDFLERFGMRIQAMAASQDLLVKNQWKAVPIGYLVRSQLAHFVGSTSARLSLTGPKVEVSVSAAQTIGMALHELATNSVKYGALSSEAGRVEIAWNVHASAGGETKFTMTWIEKGGPTVVKPTRRAFGSTVIDGMVKMAFGCDVTLNYAPAGFEWHIACPADRVIDGIDRAEKSNIEMAAVGLSPTSDRARVLVVEDGALIAVEIVSILSEAGFEVVGPASSVKQALALINSAACDVALLDTNLGTETSEPIAALLRSVNTPFALMSGYSREQQPEALRDAPLIAKPFQSQQLIAEIRRCLAATRNQ